MSKWNSGPPPSLGWWPTKDSRYGEKLVRWWNGKWWSVGLHPEEDMFISVCANYRTQVPNEKIQWANRPDSWPERSRT